MYFVVLVHNNRKNKCLKSNQYYKVTLLILEDNAKKIFVQIFFDNRAKSND